MRRGGGGGGGTERKRDRQTDREIENLNLKTLILKDSSVRSIWTKLTASACYTTNTNKHEIERERESNYNVLSTT